MELIGDSTQADSELEGSISLGLRVVDYSLMGVPQTQGLGYNQMNHIYLKFCFPSAPYMVFIHLPWRVVLVSSSFTPPLACSMEQNLGALRFITEA